MKLNLQGNHSAKEKESSMERVRAIVLDDTAASSVEYGLLLAGIALAVLASIMGVG
jgi:Flp pilus assembly pilin Flp